jgi:uncharacterized membrane protein YoaK (UPF0700 family)
VLVAQIAMGILALVCAILALAVQVRTRDRTPVISLLTLAVFFVVLMIWAGFIPVESTVLP